MLWKMMVKHAALEKSLSKFDIKRSAHLMKSAANPAEAFKKEI